MTACLALETPRGIITKVLTITVSLERGTRPILNFWPRIFRWIQSRSMGNKGLGREQTIVARGIRDRRHFQGATGDVQFDSASLCPCLPREANREC